MLANLRTNEPGFPGVHIKLPWWRGSPWSFLIIYSLTFISQTVLFITGRGKLVPYVIFFFNVLLTFCRRPPSRRLWSPQLERMNLVFDYFLHAWNNVRGCKHLGFRMYRVLFFGVFDFKGMRDTHMLFFMVPMNVCLSINLTVESSPRPPHDGLNFLKMFDAPILLDLTGIAHMSCWTVARWGLESWCQLNAVPLMYALSGASLHGLGTGWVSYLTAIKLGSSFREAFRFVSVRTGPDFSWSPSPNSPFPFWEGLEIPLIR